MRRRGFILGGSSTKVFARLLTKREGRTGIFPERALVVIEEGISERLFAIQFVERLPPE